MNEIKKYSEFITISGNKLHLEIRENNDSPSVLLFIHGTGAHAGYYSSFLDQLAGRGFTIVGIDCRGHGKSEGKRGDFTFNALLDDLDEAIAWTIQKFGNKIGVFGSSQGGLLSLYAAARNKNIKSILCHNAALLMRDGIECTRAPNFFRLTLPIMKLMGKLMPGIFLPTWTYLNMKHVFKEKKYIDSYLEDPLIVKSYTLRAILSLATARPERPFSEIKRPVMILTGELEKVIPLQVARRVFEDLSQPKKIIIIDGALHMLFIEYIEESLPVVADWFDETL